MVGQAEDTIFGRAFLVGEVLIGELLASAEKESERAGRMRRVVAEKKILAKAVYPELSDADFTYTTLRALIGQLSEASRLRLFVMQVGDDPFDPHEIKVSDKARDAALAEHFDRLGQDQKLLNAIEGAIKAGSFLGFAGLMKKFRRVGPLSLVAGVVVGLAAAPLAAMAIGATAGLYGAAALAHGLAVLGGGAISVGGYGMVGGLIAASGTGAVLGGGGSTLAALASLDEEAFEGELRNEAALFHLLFVSRAASASEAQPWIEAIEQRVRQFEARLEAEEALSDPRTDPIKQIEKRIEQLRALARWMIEHTKAKV